MLSLYSTDSAELSPHIKEIETSTESHKRSTCREELTLCSQAWLLYLQYKPCTQGLGNTVKEEVEEQGMGWEAVSSIEDREASSMKMSKQDPNNGNVSWHANTEKGQLTKPRL